MQKIYFAGDASGGGRIFFRIYRVCDTECGYANGAWENQRTRRSAQTPLVLLKQSVFCIIRTLLHFAYWSDSFLKLLTLSA